MNHSENINELATALAKAQLTIKGAKRDEANPFFKSKYADLASVWEACRDSLAVNGLSVVQFPEAAEGDAVKVCTMLLHNSGEWMSSELVLPVGKLDAQGFGSAITYARRYALAAAVGVAPEDDDAEAAVGRNAKPVKAVLEPPSAKQWLWSVINNMVKAERWDELGVDATAGPLLIIKDATGDFARTALIQRLLGRMPSTPPTDEELKTAAANLADIRDHALKMD